MTETATTPAPGRAIAILCGSDWEPWSPRTIAQVGAGGAQEAVWHVSRWLVRLGWQVTVFGDPGADAGEYDGVAFVPYTTWDPLRFIAVVISWRRPEVFDRPLNAGVRLLWLQDLAPASMITPERLANLDRVVVLSHWHRQVEWFIPDSKIFLSANGIDPETFPPSDSPHAVDEPQRAPHRLIYTSDYTRGLQYLLEMWPDVRRQVPDAQLHIYYGWNTFMRAYGEEPERLRWRWHMQQLMRQPGITHFGRVGQIAVAQAMLQAGVWAYPTDFGEVSCITAMKAQAAGAIPVVVAYAALAETVQTGIKISGDMHDSATQAVFQEQLIKVMLDQPFQRHIRSMMMPWARRRFSWERVARQWHTFFESCLAAPPPFA